MNSIGQLLKRVTAEGARRPAGVRVAFAGRERLFEAFDIGDDTFILEHGIARHLAERPSVLIVEKRRLGRRVSGRVMTLATGNHAVAAFPLLDGRFWRLARVPNDRRSATLTQAIVCGNVVDGTLELSQREVPTADVVAADAWLTDSVGLSLRDVVLVDRNVATLDHYRRRGEDWRVKPLAWTEHEMRVALAASRRRIGTSISYYHSARGVHFLTWPAFDRFARLAETDPNAFVAGLRELVGVHEGDELSFARQPKHGGHHEIEFFGLRMGVGVGRLVPELEQLEAAIRSGQVGQLGILQRAEELSRFFKSLLTSQELANEHSRPFAKALYMCLTGEVYAVVGEGVTPAFDDRRTALPGATFVDGRPVLHPGADARTEVLLSNLRGMMSKDEQIEYANVYELRGDDSTGALGTGTTREVVYKSSRRPLEDSLIEKRLSRATKGYSAYVLARIGGLRSLGVALSEFYLLLKQRPGAGRRPVDYYIRRRCAGEPMRTIPAGYFRSKRDAAIEDREVVLKLATLIGDAAAQNLVMLKYDAGAKSPLFGIGKEIYEFEYDLAKDRMVPKRVSTCSIRGTFGWPSLEKTEENLHAIEAFYFGHYAEELQRYSRRHPSVTMNELTARFMDGFEYRLRAMAWKLSAMRERFESFAPDVPGAFRFAHKWKFALWTLERMVERLPALRAGGIMV